MIALFDKIDTKLLKLFLHIIGKFTRMVENINIRLMSKAEADLKWAKINLYLPPYFCPRNLENIYKVRCKLRDRSNFTTFDENMKGF